jgi:AcrR family transcriptional regulator
VATRAPPRRGRPPKGEERLSRAAIVEAALAVIDAQGLDSVGMRSVAAQLGVDAKSLYNHVDGKEGLLDAVAEHVLASIRNPALTGVLVDDLRAIAHAFRDAALARPLAATLVLTRQLSSLAGLAPVEAVLSVLRRAGCPPAESVHLLRTLLATSIGTILREAQAGPTFGASATAAIARRKKTLEASGLPTLVEAAPYLARCDHAAEFDFAVDFMAAAVAARVAAIPRPRPTARD